MLLTSPLGLALLIVVLLVYWALSRSARFQNAWLLAASVLLYGYLNPVYPIVMLTVGAYSFFTARAISRTQDVRKREGLLAMGITFVGGSLFSLKYAVHSWNWMEGLSPLHPLESLSVLHWVAPIGLSFYTLGLIGYMVDVKRRRTAAATDPLLFLTSVSFLPHLFAGPIPKHAELLPQFRAPRRFDTAALVPALQLIVWGLFKKLVIADNLAPAVSYCFGHYAELPGSALFLGVVLASVQVYADFSGYSDIAFGAARLLGIRINRNFDRPFFATTPSTYWRRWHMSLNEWLYDYLYLPLGGRARSAAAWSLVIVGVFAFSGIWHGTGINFLLWGISNGLIYLAFHYGKQWVHGTTPVRGAGTLPFRFASWVLTFHLIALTRVFFRAADLNAALGYYSHLFTADFFTAAPAFLARYAVWCLPLVAIEAAALLVPRWQQKTAVLLPARLVSMVFCLVAIAGIYFFQGHQNALEYLYFKF